MNPALINVCLLLAVGLVRGDDIQTLSAASSDFSQRLYQKVALDKPNVVYSPYSIHSALSMTSLGAREETATELFTVLGLTALTGNRAHLAYRDLINLLNSVTDVKLNTANALFVNPNIPIEQQFVSDARTYYLAKSSNFDLTAVGGPEKEINEYVENKTQGIIHDILPKGSVDAGTVTVLVNTIFFNGTWQIQFQAGDTQTKDFQKLDGTKSQVSMMYDERYVNIKRNVLGVDVAELPFIGDRFSLYIALPNKVDGITDLESALLVPGNVDQLFQGLIPSYVKLSIPKFKIESTIGLKTPLQQLGLQKPFDPSTANFQGISSAAKVVISDVLHKAVIDVTETGTVAAATTAVIIRFFTLLEPPKETFNADHTFVFFLRDKQTNHTLFQGKFSTNVVISDVLHKAVMDVTETGTVAAAATAVITEFASSREPPAENFNADHPFVFFLRDKQTNHTLFQGKFSAKVVISDVLHKAVIDVTETGTVAAAATAVIVEISGVLEPPVETFKADHPFLFFLRYKQTNNTLFQGKFSG